MRKVKKAPSRSALQVELDQRVAMWDRADKLGLMVGQSTRNKDLWTVYRKGHPKRALRERANWQELTAYLAGWEHAQKYGKAHG